MYKRMDAFFNDFGGVVTAAFDLGAFQEATGNLVGIHIQVEDEVKRKDRREADTVEHLCLLHGAGNAVENVAFHIG